MRIVLSSTLALLAGMGTALAFPTAEVPTSEAAYIAKVKTAAPEEVVTKATIVMTQDGKERSLQTGTNGFTCFIEPKVQQLVPAQVQPNTINIVFLGLAVLLAWRFLKAGGPKMLRMMNQPVPAEAHLHS